MRRLFILLLASVALANVPQVPPTTIQAVQRLQSRHLFIENDIPGDWIIGLDDPNERVEITEPREFVGDITVVNNGQLLVRDAEFTFKGNLLLAGNSRFSVDGGVLRVPQSFAYEHDVLLTDSSRLELKNSIFRSTNQSWGIGMIGSSRFEMDSVNVRDGFLTVSCFETSSVSVNRTQLAGEYLCFGDNDMSFSHTDSVLFWMVLPENSRVEASLPADVSNSTWRFPESVTIAENVSYRVSIDHCRAVWWGLISLRNSAATFSDTRFRTSGLMFHNPDSTVVSNLSNGETMVDHRLDLPDRELRYINSTVETWNFYAAAGSNLTLENCIFGEALAMDSSYVTILTSICDGTGGYLGVESRGFMLMYGSLSLTQVITRDDGVFVGANSALRGTVVQTSDRSLMFLANSSAVAEPTPDQSSIIFVADVPPVDAAMGEQVPVLGSAFLKAGPENPIQFSGYRLLYRRPGQTRRELQPLQPNAVRQDTLAVWDTRGLEPGGYELTLRIYHSHGDSLEVTSFAFLSQPTVVRESGMPDEFALLQNYPNPFNASTTIEYSLSKPGPVRLEVYNQRAQRLAVLVNESQAAGTHQIQLNAGPWPSGMYFYRLQTETQAAIKRMMLIR